jgi:hypothetical protein
LLSTGLFTLSLCGGGFAPRHLKRCAAFSCVRMKRFIILSLLLTSCSASAVQENANFVAVQQLPTPDANIEQIQNSGTFSPLVSNTSFKFPHPEKSNLTWEDIYFEAIIERGKTSNLKRLKSKALPGDDLEIRVWSGFGITLLEGFILKRTAGEWSAVDLDWEVSENPKGKRDVKPLDKKLDVPKSGWDAAWQKLFDAGILTLPDAEKINCSGNTVDGFSYVVEYKLKNTYRTYMYDNPEYAKCDEAKQMVKINRIIAEEFYKREVKIDD